MSGIDMHGDCGGRAVRRGPPARRPAPLAPAATSRGAKPLKDVPQYPNGYTYNHIQTHTHKHTRMHVHAHTLRTRTLCLNMHKHASG